MILRSVLTKTLTEYTRFCDLPKKYNGVHVRNKTEVFAGEVLGTKWQPVYDHGNISDHNITCLRYIHCIKAGPVARHRMILLLLYHQTEATIAALAHMLHADPEEIKHYLRIDKSIDTTSIPAANAYMLSKLILHKIEVSSFLLQSAAVENAALFTPRAHELLKEHQLKQYANARRKRKQAARG